MTQAIYPKGEGPDRVILSVYVDDLLIVSKNSEECRSRKGAAWERV
jgi:hypothetical protein